MRSCWPPSGSVSSSNSSLAHLISRVCPSSRQQICLLIGGKRPSTWIIVLVFHVVCSLLLCSTPLVSRSLPSPRHWLKRSHEGHGAASVRTVPAPNVPQPRRRRRMGLLALNLMLARMVRTRSRQVAQVRRRLSKPASPRKQASPKAGISSRIKMAECRALSLLIHHCSPTPSRRGAMP